MLKKCVQCGKKFETFSIHKKYCSFSCKTKRQKERYLENKSKKLCKNCNKRKVSSSNSSYCDNCRIKITSQKEAKYKDLRRKYSLKYYNKKNGKNTGKLKTS